MNEAVVHMTYEEFLAKATYEGPPSGQCDFHLALIDEVRAHNNIWNDQSPLFQNDALRRKSWNDIATKLNSDAITCQRKFHTMHNAYLHPNRKTNIWINEYPGLMFLTPTVKHTTNSVDQPSIISTLSSTMKLSRFPEEQTPLSSFSISDKVDFQSKLADEVRLHDNIWNRHSPHFHNEVLKKACWVQIAAKLDADANECQASFDTMRNAYFNCHKSSNFWIKEYINSLKFLSANIPRQRPIVGRPPKSCKQSSRSKADNHVQFPTMLQPSTNSTAQRRFQFKLVEEVRLYGNIWNIHSPLFHDKVLKKETWTKIATKLNAEANECQTRFTLMRNAYLRHDLVKNSWIKEYLNSLKFLSINSKNNVQLPISDQPLMGYKLSSGSIKPVRLPKAQPSSSKLSGSSPCKFEHRLIEEVRSHENLWNTSLKIFKKENLKTISWRQISNKLKTTAEKCQSTFFTLHAKYFKVRSKSTSTEWEFYDSLKFLDKADAQNKNFLPGIIASSRKRPLKSQTPVDNSMDIFQCSSPKIVCSYRLPVVKIEEEVGYPAVDFISASVPTENQEECKQSLSDLLKAIKNE